VKLSELIKLSMKELKFTSLDKTPSKPIYSLNRTFVNVNITVPVI